MNQKKESNIMKKPVIITLVVLLMLVFTVQAFALTADEILDQMEEKRAVNTTQKSVGKMTLSDDKGKEEIRDLVCIQLMTLKIHKIVLLYFDF